MKNQKQSPHKKTVLGVVLLVILVAITSVTFYLSSNNKSANDSSTQPPKDISKSESSISSNRNNNDEESVNQDSINTSKNDTHLIQSEQESSVIITKTADTIEGGVYRLRYLINTVGSGTCNLILKKGSATVTKNTNIQALANSSTCQGFDIPVSELSKGAWTASLNVKIGTKTGSLSHTSIIP